MITGKSEKPELNGVAKATTKEAANVEKLEEDKVEIIKEKQDGGGKEAGDSKGAETSSDLQTSPSIEPKYDVIGLLEKGCALRCDIYFITFAIFYISDVYFLWHKFLICPKGSVFVCI